MLQRSSLGFLLAVFLIFASGCGSEAHVSAPMAEVSVAAEVSATTASLGKEGMVCDESYGNAVECLAQLDSIIAQLERAHARLEGLRGLLDGMEETCCLVEEATLEGKTTD